MERTPSPLPHERSKLPVLTPAPVDRAIIHRIIYEELCRGEFLPESREHISRIIRSLAAEGADSLILGCTEIPLLIGQADSALPIFDTTLLHAEAAVEWALR